MPYRTYCADTIALVLSSLLIICMNSLITFYWWWGAHVLSKRGVYDFTIPRYRHPLGLLRWAIQLSMCYWLLITVV